MFGLGSLNLMGSRKQAGYRGIERRCGERRIHADRRREPRVGDIRERRSGIDRRV